MVRIMDCQPTNNDTAVLEDPSVLFVLFVLLEFVLFPCDTLDDTSFGSADKFVLG